MALHAKILKHNILRVSKLRKLSHTTQAIERNFEKNASSGCRPELGDNLGGCHQSSTENSQPELYTSGSPKLLSSWCVPMDLVELLSTSQQHGSSLQHLSPQHKALMPLSLSGLETLLLGNSSDSVSGAFHPHDRLSSIIKPISYTADDIFIQPPDLGVECILSQNILCKSHGGAVTEKSDQDLDSDKTLLRTRQFGNNCFMTNVGVVTPSMNVARNGVGVQVSDVRQSAPSADMHTVLYCAEGSSQARGGKVDPEGSEKGPNLDQLRKVEQFFIETLPEIFRSRIDYGIYHPELVFENNFWGKNEVFVGLKQYAAQMMKWRALTHLKYAHVHVEVVSTACLLDNGIVRIHWRIIGLSQLKALKFWKYTAWSYGKSFREDAEWVDGISIFHVNKDGLVAKHRMDRMMPDEEQTVRKTPPLATRLAIIMGLSAPKLGLSDFSSLFCYHRMLAQKLT